MAANELAAEDFELCYKFLTCPSAQVLTMEQEQFLERVRCFSGIQRRQVTLMIGLRLTDCRVEKPLTRNLRYLTKRVEVTERAFPIKFEVTTLWFGSNAFAMPFDMDAIENLASMPGVCVQNTFTDAFHSLRMQSGSSHGSLQRQWTHPLQYFAPQVLLHPSLRKLSLSRLQISPKHFSSICPVLRASNHLQELSLRTHRPLRRNTDEKNVIWAWIAFGILHKDSSSGLRRLNLTKTTASPQILGIVSQILSSPHPGRQLVRVISSDLITIIDKEEWMDERG